MAEIDVLKAQIVRQDLNTAWGFVLQGGVDQGSQLIIHSLAPGSPAARIGLKSGDEVTEIGDLPTEGLTYQQVHELLDRHGDTLILTVERRARGAMPVNHVMAATDTEQLKDYQTYDMAGRVQQQQHQQPAPAVIPAVFEDASQSAPEPMAQASDETPAVVPDETSTVESTPDASVPVAPEGTQTAPAAPAVVGDEPVTVEAQTEVVETATDTANIIERVLAEAAQVPAEDSQPPAEVSQSPAEVVETATDTAKIIERVLAEAAQVPAEVSQPPAEVVHTPAEIAQTQIPQVTPEIGPEPGVSAQEAVPAEPAPIACMQTPAAIVHAPEPVAECAAVYQHAPIQAIQPQAPIAQQPVMAQTGSRTRTRARPALQHAAPPPAGPISQIVLGHQPPQLLSRAPKYTPRQVPQFTPAQNVEMGYAPAVAVPVHETHSNSVAVLRSSEQAPASDLGIAVVVSGGRRRRPQPEPTIPTKPYQTYDMNGPRGQQPAPGPQPPGIQFETVRARKFEDQPRPYYRPQPQSPPPPLVSPPHHPAPPPHQQYAPPPHPQQYSPRSYDYQDYPAPTRTAPEDEFHPVQSRTFNVLQSLMNSDVKSTARSLSIPDARRNPLVASPSLSLSIANPNTPTRSLPPLNPIKPGRSLPSLNTTTPGRPIPTLNPNSQFSSLNPNNPFPWRRRHTLGELSQNPVGNRLYRSTSYQHDIRMTPDDTEMVEATSDMIFVDSDRSVSPTPSDRSDASSRSFLTSETYQMVQDMDKQRTDAYQADTTAHWQTKPAVDPAIGSRPWFYRRYSHQVQSRDAEVDEELSGFPMRRSKPKDTSVVDDWDFEGLQSDVRNFVDREKRAKIERGEYIEPLVDCYPTEDATEDPDQSQSSMLALGDSGYLTPSSAMSLAGDISLDPVVVDVPHYDLESLPVETVNPADYPELVVDTTDRNPSYYNLQTYESRAKLHLIKPPPKFKPKVNLIVLSRDQLVQYRRGRVRSQKH